MLIPDNETTAAMSEGASDSASILFAAFLHLHEVVNRQVQVVEEKNNETIGSCSPLWNHLKRAGRGGSSGHVVLKLDALLNGESADQLRLTSIEDLEVLFLQIAHGPILLISNHHRH